MTRIMIRQAAPDGVVFTSDAFSGQIGASIRFTAPGKAGSVKLVAASVAADGLSVMLTVDDDESQIDLGDIVGVPRRP